MKIRFQIIHNFQSDPLKVIGEVLHLTLQDDLYNQLDLRTTLDFIKVNLNKLLQSDTKLCYFEIDIDETFYDLSKYDDFIDGFDSRLKSLDGFIRLVKFSDEFRISNYLKYFEEIAEIEMNIREVFSFIFYSKYNSEEVDKLDEYDIKYPADKPTNKDFEDRSENPFFYFTFTGYYQFDKPKELPVKEIIPLIQTNELYDHLRNYLNLRGILEERHIDFLKKIREKLGSIETVRNCVAHNRAIPNRAVSSYEKVKPEVHKFIEDFWAEETRIEQEKPENEINFAEQYSYDRLKELLSVAEWNEYNYEVVLHDFWQTGTPEFKFNNLADLKAHLLDISDNTATANFPSNADDREAYDTLYNGEFLVDKTLNEYKKELIILGWL
ncbi:Abi family protein [Cyclobacterium salsum]|uniref:Abi family protein n=1 Tax=Cyclobacterium salsum TaxID=2666329 RepID=UPI001391C7CB|nr:Abi family protein [Cyclobacterium salsum]